MSPDLAHREPAERPDPTSCPAQAAVLIDPGPRLAKGRLVGRALMTLPKLLMLDEPSLGLAPLIGPRTTSSTPALRSIAPGRPARWRFGGDRTSVSHARVRASQSRQNALNRSGASSVYRV